MFHMTFLNIRLQCCLPVPEERLRRTAIKPVLPVVFDTPSVLTVRTLS
jgi:hypothetical protein